MSILIDEPLAEYASPEEHAEHAEFARLVASYHELRAMSMQARLAGDIQQAQGLETAADAVAAEIENRS